MAKPPSTNWHTGAQWGYTGVTYPTVYEENIDNFVLAPVSTANSYTYVPNNELLGELGEILHDNYNFTREANYLSATNIDSFGVYRDMTVNTTYSNVAVRTNDMVLEWLKSYSSNNDVLAYGVNICNYDENGKMQIELICTESGTIKIGAGFNANDAYSKMQDFDVNVGSNEIEIEVKKNEGTDIFLIYLPSSVSALGRITNITATLISE